jgi:hypothetical protein
MKDKRFMRPVTTRRVSKGRPRPLAYASGFDTPHKPRSGSVYRPCFIGGSVLSCESYYSWFPARRPPKAREILCASYAILSVFYALLCVSIHFLSPFYACSMEAAAMVLLEQTPFSREISRPRSVVLGTRPSGGAEPRSKRTSERYLPLSNNNALGLAALSRD